MADTNDPKVQWLLDARSWVMPIRNKIFHSLWLRVFAPKLRSELLTDIHELVDEWEMEIYRRERSK